ncbi:MAG: adenylate/guanylate cyclase domain-containing protein [Oscillatoriaceae bacterium SKW80]|nr:adenylate/guanylate cyclase domain-containing protein [Oscillatoriaceae bacterium SKYG93]MCX8121878.1 adenylate/guanylate cyclase domain-containing protein [Oscillatoriaceae bacterium SKW80]MDW8454639.1 adenylate/guanylate cyclase domain-containing protein [Oscillatoriaceae cyanobacterium SKYGB_i_bin93]
MQPPQDAIEKKINGNSCSAFLKELFGNSGHFLILKSLADLIVLGWGFFITDPTEYLLLFAMLLQTWYLSRAQANRFWGNIIGATIYTIIDLPVDKLAFFKNPIHIVFWVFSLLIATLQGLRCHWIKSEALWTIPLESLTRTIMVVALYVVVGIYKNGKPVTIEYILQYTATPSHYFLTWSMVFCGLLLGFQALQITTQQKQLQETAQVLRSLAEWGMGNYAVMAAVNNPEILNFHKCERAIVFMDIRGFTAWSERNSPETVAAILNEYYRSVEPAAAQHHPLRINLTADEIMAIYTTPHQAVSAALAMRQAALKTLTSYQMGAGCAVHYGTVIEGLFGSESVRTYTVIGDVVNTAKRLESVTPAGEITISDVVYQAMNFQLNVKPCAPIVVKGKTEALAVWRLLDE